ncbi:hypothetical protein TOPH_05608 [Tolypocladium ophioglossoides CBS 100239]|uniref:Uncharacterized protein n=1 Tax=Tolypocladium ophioglossoides (strain CBS 100239) TaxID=1163406 RepID=A0A0L0N651_TOLOC|nr:hypothetical protein TOPH_05608 [Tolypocladium ophioglossoides CBS 100239]
MHELNACSPDAASPLPGRCELQSVLEFPRLKVAFRGFRLFNGHSWQQTTPQDSRSRCDASYLVRAESCADQPLLRGIYIPPGLALTLRQMDGDGAVAGPRDASEDNGPAPVSVPKISFDFVTSEVGQFTGNWCDNSSGLPLAASSKPDEAITPPGQAPDVRLEVAIPEVPTDMRYEYATVYSDVVERITDAVGGRGQAQYHVEFTDGREDLVRHTNEQLQSHISNTRFVCVCALPWYGGLDL